MNSENYKNKTIGHNIISEMKKQLKELKGEV
jgi:hypothetical protein